MALRSSAHLWPLDEVARDPNDFSIHGKDGDHLAARGADEIRISPRPAVFMHVSPCMVN